MNAHSHIASDCSQRLTSRLLVRGDPADRRALDGLLSRHAATPFHSLAWCEAVSAAAGHELHYLIAENGAGQMCGAVPLHAVHSPLFGRALVSSAFAVDGGIICNTPAIGAMLAENAWALAERLSCPTLELRGGFLPTGKDWHVKSDSHAGFVQPLAVDDEVQLQAVPRKQRAELRKGLRREMQVRVGRGKADRDMHYAVYAESVRNLGTPVFPRSLFEHVMNRFGEDADILTVLDQGRPVSSVLSLYHKGNVMPYWGGGIWQARQFRANEVMYYALMCHARQRGSTHFDFGRSKTGSGAYHYKKNWGFAPTPLTYAARAVNGAVLRDINPNSPKYKAQIALWKRLPLSLANRLGPIIASGLG